MPKFGVDDNLDKHNIGHFGFTAKAADELDASGAGFTLATIVCDKSGSTDGFQKEMEAALISSVAALRRLPTSDSILLRVLTISTACEEVHGFIPLPDIDPNRYQGILAAGGNTALYDGCVNAAEAMTEYGRQLHHERFKANGIAIVITDGENNAGKFPAALGDVTYVQKAFAEAVRSEALESFTTILIGVNMQNARVAGVLQIFHEEAGFSVPFIELKDASEKTIAKIGKFVTDSVSSTSMSLGSGGPSQTLKF